MACSSRHSWSVMPFLCWISPPEETDLSPVSVMMMQRNSSGVKSPGAKIRLNSMPISVFNALRVSAAQLSGKHLWGGARSRSIDRIALG